MLTKHYFNKDGKPLGKAVIGSIVVPEDAVVIENMIEEYPYPVKLEEGVVVQDTDKKPFKGRWRSSSEVGKMKAELEKSNNGVAEK